MDCINKPLNYLTKLFLAHHVKITSLASLILFGSCLVSELMDGILTADDFRRLAEGASGSQLVILGIAYMIFKRKSS